MRLKSSTCLAVRSADNGEVPTSTKFSKSSVLRFMSKRSCTTATTALSCSRAKVSRCQCAQPITTGSFAKVGRLPICWLMLASYSHRLSHVLSRLRSRRARPASS